MLDRGMYEKVNQVGYQKVGNPRFQLVKAALGFSKLEYFRHEIKRVANTATACRD